MFGIVQGGASKPLRIESAKALASMDFMAWRLAALRSASRRTSCLRCWKQ